ncbi:Xenobiotic-transporting ATPase [Syntrophobotulus glycolicus DSM 8271]|uniref:Xenobiotic-transporting ATPase n=1 Tax=Syntrophobotulus glycolicus (strain DSM 8271 / FlGlyR) TaxID=645991 RepID=F0SV48_SYNGF|nr:ABC transporter ATP-binding protein [Syntrophobotulus glycolicus]ADY55548.1 Xenobiotic-transporting ATPase [Syntrophobotulus glycolicus DSM 8271]
MNDFATWFHTITFGETKKFLKLTLWNFLDSFVVSLPYAVMLLAVYLLLIPLAEPGAAPPLNRLWLLCGVLLAQTVVYYFIRRKTYIDICVGFAGTTKNARLAMGEHLRRLPMGFFGRRDAGDLSTVLLRDYTEVENLASALIPQVSVILVRLALAVAVLSAFDWRMMLAVVLAIPLALPFAFLSYRRMGRISRQLLAAQQAAASGILEYVGGIQTLKAFNLAGERFAALKSSFARQHRHSVGLELAAAPVGMIGRFVLSCGIGAVMLAGAWLLTGGELAPFTSIVFLLLSLNIYEPVMILFGFIADFARTNRSAARIRELRNEQPLPEPQPKTAADAPSEAAAGAAPDPKAAAAPDAAGSNMDIAFQKVSFSYGSQEVLHQISLRFPAKSITALVGPSGSGKSTITRLAARFWDADSGEITLGGVSVREMTSDTLLSRISMVFQDVYLFHDTIEANIRMGKPDASMAEIMEAARTAACHDFISVLPDGYQTVVGEGGSTLSGGEKQRISIARALLKNAPIVLLDEATASLDPENEVLIQQAISALVAEKTVIVIAHRLHSICSADQIIVLENGAVKERGGHEELLRQNGLYARLWAEQSRAASWQITATV